MVSIEVFQLVVVSFILGLSILGANLLFLRDRNRQVCLPLAWFFVAQAFAVLPLIIVALGITDGLNQITILLELSTIPISMTQAPLFWLYVRGLTSETTPEKVPNKILHFLPIVIVILAITMFSTVPNDVIAHLDLGQEPVDLMQRRKVSFLVAAGFLFYLQISFYLVRTVGLLITYNTRLKDLFSSTEEHELTWIWWISIAAAIFLLFGSAGLFADVLGFHILPNYLTEYVAIEIIAELPITWVIALWGLRQQSGVLLNNKASKDTSRTEVKKYERSALTDVRSQRIANKIDIAMENDNLYRNPNLSLWDLANHIGSTTSYVSQTLNKTLGNNFFDYVNRWRIKEAVDQMLSTDKTILAITYDVGFNSRSSFYKAFKREMGITPSALKQKRDAGLLNPPQ